MISVTGDRVKMRVWERGVGETLACGTGMVAAAAVALDGVDGTITSKSSAAQVRYVHR